MAGGEVVSEIRLIHADQIDVFGFKSEMYPAIVGLGLAIPPCIVRTITCLTCKRETISNGTPPAYGTPLFTPMSHDPHCPARNHVYLEGIGPMIEPRAMVFEKEDAALS